MNDADRGRVYIVGAGPGDPGLLTVRATELIATADVVLYDRLIGAETLDGVRADAELVYVGKAGGAPGAASVPQAETEELMVAHARAGKSVVRLKGGDPFVFGRGGEEALTMLQAGIPFEVVPGITAGLSATAYAGIPVTFRGVSSAVALITGHEDTDKGEPALDWAALATFPGTLVFYMGVGALPAIVTSLMAAGRRGSEAAALVECGTLPWQRTVTATLDTLAETAAAANVRPPALTVIGEVASFSERLHWFGGDGLPLKGRSVVVTRARPQAGELADRLRRLGATVVQTPTIRIEPIAGPSVSLSGYDIVCLTSPNGVHALFERLHAGGQDARAFAGTVVAAIGPGTAQALADRGIRADVVPERSVAEGLVEALLDDRVAPSGPAAVRRALFAGASGARETLPEALRASGIEVDVVSLYETVSEPLSQAALAAARQADYITFASSSSVRALFGALESESDLAALAPTTRIVSIGPVTSETLREHGAEPHVQATRHDIDGLVAALVQDATAAVGSAPAERS